MQAHDIQIEWDEGGCYLIIDDGTQLGQSTRIGVLEPEQLYDRVKAAIGPWLREREEAFAEFRQAVRSGTGPAAFLCNPDESGGYALTDPHHPDYHDAMSDIWDSREKC